MSKFAWGYVCSVIAMGAALMLASLVGVTSALDQLPTFAVFAVLATLGTLFKARAPNHQSYHANILFFFSGMLLLHPFFFVLTVLIPHIIEWAKERLTNSPRLRNWYLQPFNISLHIIAGFAARLVANSLEANYATAVTPTAIIAVVAAAVTYVVVNHLYVGQALVLARQVPWRESGILDYENLATDLNLLLLGYTGVILWNLNPWLLTTALAPLVVIYRALSIPQLKKEAQTDEKTGLWNARHFTKLFASEFQRASRFDRPLSVIISDLDLLRNINNTYGHLAGDAVLAGVGKIIRATIREYDIGARFGGEEFLIALPETRSGEAQAIAERLREVVENHLFEIPTHPSPIRATMSFGVAAYPQDAATTNDLIHQSDLAVYQAKLKGRNSVVCAAEVPRSAKLDNLTPRNRLNESHLESVPVKSERIQIPASTPKPATTKSDEPKTIPPEKSYPKGLLALYVGAVIAAGIAATLVGFSVSGVPMDWVVTGVLMLLVVVTQLTQLKNLGRGSSVSVAAAINFAAALIGGIPTAALVGAAMEVAHRLGRLKSRQPFYVVAYKSSFNWSIHLLSAIAPAVAFRAFSSTFQFPDSLYFGGLIGVAAVISYLTETGLLAGALSLENSQNVVRVWNEEFKWIGGHYFILCVMGFILSIAFALLGVIGIIFFTLPVLMMHYAEKAYTERMHGAVEELKRMNDELRSANHQVRDASATILQLNDELFLTLAKIIDARDPYVSGHSSKVADYATAIAKELGLPNERVDRVRQAAFLHDLGKIAISEQILNKPARLNPVEYEYIKTHVTLGADFLETSQALRHLAPAVKHHHEWWDGKGYPDQLSGEDIPIESRILSVCDAVEAMASDRAYHKAMRLEEIIAEIVRCSGSQFDPSVVKAFIQIVLRPGESLVVNSAREVVEKHGVHARNGDGDGHGNLLHEPPAPVEENGWFIAQIGLTHFSQ